MMNTTETKIRYINIAYVISENETYVISENETEVRVKDYLQRQIQAP